MTRHVGFNDFRRGICEIRAGGGMLNFTIGLNPLKDFRASSAENLQQIVGVPTRTWLVH
jgi:hypothetical protein